MKMLHLPVPGYRNRNTAPGFRKVIPVLAADYSTTIYTQKCRGKYKNMMGSYNNIATKNWRKTDYLIRVVLFDSAFPRGIRAIIPASGSLP